MNREHTSFIYVYRGEILFFSTGHWHSLAWLQERKELSPISYKCHQPIYFLCFPLDQHKVSTSGLLLYTVNNNTNRYTSEHTETSVWQVLFTIQPAKGITISWYCIYELKAQKRKSRFEKGTCQSRFEKGTCQGSPVAPSI